MTMPLYDYACRNGHTTERLVRAPDRIDSVATCPHCGATSARVFPFPHVAPDGVYSYAPNVGTEREFERKRAALREGTGGYLRDE